MYVHDTYYTAFCSNLFYRGTCNSKDARDGSAVWGLGMRLKPARGGPRSMGGLA